MSLLSVHNLEKSFGGETLFEGVTFRLEWRQKLGLVGRNGSGKTTLLRILTGQEEPDRGTVACGAGVRFGYLRQEAPVDPTRTVLQEAEDAFAHVLAMEQRLRAIEQEMARAAGCPEQLEQVLSEYGLMHDRFEAMGGYDNLRDIPAVLRRLGFGPEDLNKPCGALSGGEKTRLALARLLLSGPDILFLDEPTNHLDIEATEWLEAFLRDFGGAVVLVSHDRYFLDRVATTTAELAGRRLTLYRGNFSAYFQQKQASRQRQAELYEREQKEIQRLMEFYEKWKNTPSRKNQAMMRLRWAERIRQYGLSGKGEATARPDTPGRSPRLTIKASQLSGTETVILDNVGKRYGNRVLFEGVTALIRRGDRVGIVGPNGAGKSTLVKILLGRETPTSGMARLGASVTVGYFAQDTGDLDLDATVLENLLNVREMDWTQARTYLGRFLFTGDDVFKPVRLLSGGEKNKLVLAQLTLLQPNLLILDEPTNHLDLESREALGQMLRQYDGTLILVSHDRYLLDQVTNRTFEVADGHVTIYDGPYSEFRAQKEGGSLPASARVSRETMGDRSRTQQVERLLAERPGPACGVPAGLNAHQLSKERQRARQAVAKAEQKVASLEARLKAIEQILSCPAPNDNVIALAQEYSGVQSALEDAMALWERAAAYAESLG